LYSPETEEEMEQEMANIADAAPLADEMLIELEQQHLIRAALKQLEERCQKILSMLYLNVAAASYSEVAEAVGVGETSISPLRSRCLKKLEKLLSS
jgi:RNA polymerase sigma factor (sigma-70 family)